MSVRKLWVTRNELRQMGIDVSNTQFNRWEAEGLLIPFKVGGHRSAIVRYRLVQVLRAFAKHTVRKVQPLED